MAQFPTLSGGLTRALLDLARPILKWPPPAKKHVDAAEKRAANQVMAQRTPSPAPARLARRAIASAQVVKLEAVPPLLWEAAGFRCVAAETLITVRTTDGAETTQTYPSETLIPVVSGLILFPDESG